MKMSSRVVVLCAVLGALVAPACEIRIGKGTSGEISGEIPIDPSGGTTGSGAATSFTPEEQEAIDAVENPDNQLAVAKADLTAQFASYTLQGLVDMNAGDLSLLDEATLRQLVDQYAPIAAQQALQWIKTVDPSTIDLGYIQKKSECVAQQGCKHMEACDFGNGLAACPITGCGGGKCPACPDLFSLDNLIVKGWCSHTCVQNQFIVGIKIVLHVAIAGELFACVPLDKTPL
jgi:hypothetical protein